MLFGDIGLDSLILLDSQVGIHAGKRVDLVCDILMVLHSSWGRPIDIVMQSLECLRALKDTIC